MTQLMLRISSTVMATAAMLLMGIAVVLAVPGTASAEDAAKCPAEQDANGKCAGACKIAGDVCTPGTLTIPGGTRKVCACLPEEDD